MLPQNSRTVFLLLSIAANALFAGGVFTFPLLSGVLAEHVKLTQPQLTSIVLAGMAGQYPCTPLVGMIIDRRGPWLCSLIAAFLFSIAFAGFSYQVNEMISTGSQPSPTSAYFLVFLFALAGFATVFSYFSSLFAATKNFPNYPGVASGTVTALFGLSPLLFSFVATRFFNNITTSLDLVGFTAFLAISAGLVNLIGAINLRGGPMPVLLSRTEVTDETTPLLSEVRVIDPNASLMDVVQDPYFWVLFFMLAVTLGPCEMVMSNIGTIILSLPLISANVYSGSSGDTASAQVKILAIFNVATRLFTGPIADLISPIPSQAAPRQRKHHMSRIVFLVGAAVVLGVTFIWMEIAVHSRGDIWVLSVGTGIAYGTIFTVLPGIVGAVWGMRHVGRNYGLVVYAPLLGTSLFSYLYALVSAHHSSSDEVCRGSSCWKATFWITAGLQAASIGSGLILWRGWKGLL